MSLVLVVLLVLTGILMMLAYEPSPERAYASVRTIQQEIRFGGLVRNVHHWTANLLVIVLFLHLLRTFFTGAYHGARQFNWVIGVLLLLVVLGSNFTGYLLPWDQLSYWAVTIVTGMLQYVPLIGEGLETLARGGSQVGSATLIVYYTLHTTILPVLIFALMAFHFWRVRKAGGVVVPTGDGSEPERKPATVLYVPELLVREFSAALILIAAVLLFSVFVDARLADAANPGMSPNPAKAPWYFLGLQELLLHFHPTVAVVVIPALALLALLAIPYLKYDDEASGRWFLSLRGRNMVLVAVGIALVGTPAWVVLDEIASDPAAWIPAVPPAISHGLIPLAVALAALTVLYFGLKRTYSATKNEAIQAVFAVLATGLLVLTAVGIWFRGPGMALQWPWSG
jgi:quinol-cytochrome oxidoreductase complex cytochrome b subunit